MASHRKKKRSSNAGMIFAGIAAVAAIVICIVLFSKDSGIGKNTKLENDIIISGIDVSSMSKKDALSSLRSAEEKIASQYEMTMVYKKYSRVVDAEELGIKFNTAELLDKARSGDRLEITESFEDKSIKKIASETEAEVYKDKKEPSVKSFDFDTLEFTFDEGQDGYSINASELEAQIKDFLETTKKGELELSPQKIKRKLSSEELESSFSEISVFSTECKNNENSEHNMRLAMEYMDETVIGPGEVFSFNETTGDSTTAEGGWVKSSAWVDGRLEDQYGGGLCQAATTFYNAALLGNMDVVERWEHQQPSSYCTEGLDATIDYPNMDLKMKNTTDYPIYVSAKMDDMILTVTLYGYISPEFDHIEIDGWFTDTLSIPEAEFVLDKNMDDGEYVLEESGEEGEKAEAERRFIDFDGNVIRTEQLPSSEYSGVAPLYKIGPNTDKSSIPVGSEYGYASFDTDDYEDDEENVSAHTDPGLIRG